MRDMRNMGSDMKAVGQQLSDAVNNKIPRYIGEMLVDEFRESFDLQKFNDDGQPKWKEVKRRILGSRWYGFQYGTNSRVPLGSRGYTPKGKPRRFGTRGGKTHFSPAATTRSILRGSGSINLQESIYLHTSNRAKVIVATDQPHAAVHNEGLKARIFGGREFTMPKRQFMGHTKRADRQAKVIIERYFNTIFK